MSTHSRSRLLAEQLEDRCTPTTFNVTTLADSGAGSLRQAILDANNEAANPGSDTIIFTGAAAGGTIGLTSLGGTQFGPNALEITSIIIINGTGETITRATASNMRLFFVGPAGNLTLNNVTLSNGKAQGGNGGTNLGDNGGGGGGGLGAGGAIYNQGTVTITGGTLSGNSAIGGNGGGGADGTGTDDGGGGGGGMGGNGGATASNNAGGGAGGGGFAGNGAAGGVTNGGGGGGTTSDGAVAGTGGALNGGPGGAANADGTAGGGGGGGGGAGVEANGGAGGVGGGGGGGGENDDATPNGGGAGGFGGGGGGGGEDGAGGNGGFGGGGGGGSTSGEASIHAGGTGGTFGGSGGSAQATEGSGGGGGGAGLGGAIFNDGGTITITNSTISTNTASGGTAGTSTGTAAAATSGLGHGGGIFNHTGTVTIVNSTITSNTATTDGGGIANGANMTVTNTMIASNTAGDDGGGVELVDAAAILTISGSTVATNTAVDDGGGIDTEAGGTLTITDTSVTANKAGDNGAGLELRTATVTINRVTVSGNQVTGATGAGGGLRIAVTATVTILNSTVVDNTSTDSGGGFSIGDATVTITNTTITGNSDTSASADRSGGISAEATSTVTLSNSVVAQNTTADTVSRDIRGTFAATSKNNFFTFLDANTNITAGANGNIVGADPQLGPLQNNGGLTQTRLPLTGSPLINVGSNDAVPVGTTLDQRGFGFLRLINVVDIGAVEVQPPFPLIASGQTNGSAAIFTPNTAGAYVATPSATITPFGALGTNVRVAAGDVNGDGFADTIAVTGPGTPIRVTVIDGKDNTTVLVSSFDPFGGDFTGGGFVASGDINKDGRAEFVVTPDQGGGPRVTIFSRNPDGTVATLSNFFGIDDPNFRGGARSALGDINKDGTLDLVVTAGFLGGPRAAVFNGTTILTSTPSRLVGDFFAFPGADAITLRNGSFVAVGDVDGDGFADLVFGGGPGGAPRIFILSGALVTAGNVDGAQAAPIANFFVANNSTDRGGIRLATTNADGDAKADVVAGSGEGSPSRVRVYLGKNFSGVGEPATFQDIDPFAATLPGGVFVG